MNRYLVYAPKAPTSSQKPGEEFVLLKFKDPAKTYTKEQIDGLIERREPNVFEGSVNYRIVDAVDEQSAVVKALAAKLKYEEPGVVMMRDDRGLDAFMNQHMPATGSGKGPVFDMFADMKRGPKRA